MNAGLQVGLGLLPGAVCLCFILIRRRITEWKKILPGILVSLVCLFCLAQGMISGIRHAKKALSKRELIEFASALTLEEDYETAKEVLGEYGGRYGMDQTAYLLNARIHLLSGDYERASGMYHLLDAKSKAFPEKEAEFVFANMENPSGDLSVYQYLVKHGAKPEDYGYSREEYERLKHLQKQTGNQVPDVVRKELEKYPVSGQTRAVAAFVAGNNREGNDSGAAPQHPGTDAGMEKQGTDQASEGLSGFLKGRGGWREAEEKSRPSGNEWIEHTRLYELDCVKKAKLKTDILAGDFQTVARRIGPDSSYHERMIAAELYMGNFVAPSDFSDQMQGVQDREKRAIRKQLARIVQRNAAGMQETKKQGLKERIAAIDKEIEAPVLSELKNQLYQEAQQEGGSDQTKIYLELSKITDHFENKKAADSFLEKAIYNSARSEDTAYASAMSKIMRVLNHTEDQTEDIKNVSQYVDQVLDHSLTVDVEGMISANSDYVRTATDFVSRKKSAVSIGTIDVSAFPDIKVQVQIDSEDPEDVEALKKALRVYDCGAEIRDFSLKKFRYSGSNVMLVCDVSGSMSDRIEDLKEAVISFVRQRGKHEKIGIETFDDQIQAVKGFGTGDAELIAFANDFSAMGGTDIDSAVKDGLRRFRRNPEEANILLLMTDGLDSNPKETEVLTREIEALAKQHGVLVYALGLGSEVNTEYLNAIAAGGGGAFVYVSDSESLSDFYRMLHGQIYNRYELSFRAEDTLTMTGRKLAVELPDEKLRDEKTYQIGAEQAGVSQTSDDLKLSGFSPGCIYAGDKNYTIRLKGSGFEKGQKVSVRLEGAFSYTLPASYVNDETYEIELPASIAPGNYTATVSMDGRKKVLPHALSVVAEQGTVTTKFGPYIFTSATRDQDGNRIVLRGNVTMNHWLHFKDEIVLEGDLHSGSITVEDHGGVYIEYEEKNAEGLGKFFAKNGIPVNLMPLQRFRLYDDPLHRPDEDAYMTDDISAGFLELFNLVTIDRPTFRLYPDSLAFVFGKSSLNMRYQKSIFQTHGELEEIFSYELQSDIRLTGRKIAWIFHAKYKDEDSNIFSHSMNVFGGPVHFNGEVEADIDTLKQEYAIGAMVNFAFLDKNSGIGAKVAWGEDMMPDSAKLKLKLKDGVKLPTAVPLVLNDFSFEVSDISKAVKESKWGKLKFTGTTSISSEKLSSYFPVLKKFIKDVSVFELPDVTASFRADPFLCEAEAKLMLLEDIEIAHAKGKLGTFSYENSLLNLLENSVSGFTASLSTGIKWEPPGGSVKVNIGGSGEVSAHDRFLGIGMEGDIRAEIGWWILRMKTAVSGKAVLGLYTTSTGEFQFVFRYRTVDTNGKTGGKFYAIDQNGHAGSVTGILT